MSYSIIGWIGNILFNLLQNIRAFIRFIVELPFKLAEFGIVLIGILTTMYILWWIYTVPQPATGDTLSAGTNTNV
jgi:hypothetical protein